ncbi:MAG: hypothetical protein M3O15_12165, partial [Acidobacteriota bacterium]|nr:hypothetical protein [Acidobacteriota bacterium]
IEELCELHSVPALLLQGARDESVPWHTVVDFAARCRRPRVEMHLFANGDHRLTDRMERLWELMQGFLRAERLI